MAFGNGTNGGNGESSGDIVALAGKYVAKNILVIVRNLGIVLFALWVWNNKLLDWNYSRKDMEQKLVSHVDEIGTRLDQHLAQSGPMMTEYLENKGAQKEMNAQTSRDISDIKRDIRDIKESLGSLGRRTWQPRGASEAPTDTGIGG